VSISTNFTACFDFSVKYWYHTSHYYTVSKWKQRVTTATTNVSYVPTITGHGRLINHS